MGGLSARLPEIETALLELPHDEVDEPYRSWLREQYRRIVPVVLADALRAVEDGRPLSPECVTGLRTLAQDCCRTDVPLAVSLRAALPAVRVYCRFLEQDAGSAVHAARVMVRAGVVAQELGSIWVEAWSQARAAAAEPPDALGAGDGAAGLEPLDVEMLALVAEGRSNDEIAEATHYSRQAVGWRLSRLMRRWRASNRAALTAQAFRKGVIAPRRR